MQQQNHRLSQVLCHTCKPGTGRAPLSALVFNTTAASADAIAQNATQLGQVRLFALELPKVFPGLPTSLHHSAIVHLAAASRWVYMYKFCLMQTDG